MKGKRGFGWKSSKIFLLLEKPPNGFLLEGRARGLS